MVMAKDEDGNIYKVINTDQRYRKGVLVGINKDKVTVINEFNETQQIDVQVFRNNRDKYKSNLKDTTTAKDKHGNTFNVHKDDPRWQTGQIVGINRGVAYGKDKDGNTIKTFKDDPRFKTNQLRHNAKGMIVAKDRYGNKFHTHKDDPRWQTGQIAGQTKKNFVIE